MVDALEVQIFVKFNVMKGSRVHISSICEDKPAKRSFYFLMSYHSMAYRYKLDGRKEIVFANLGVLFYRKYMRTTAHISTI